MWESMQLLQKKILSKNHKKIHQFKRFQSNIYIIVVGQWFPLGLQFQLKFRLDWTSDCFRPASDASFIRDILIQRVERREQYHAVEENLCSNQTLYAYVHTSTDEFDYIMGKIIEKHDSKQAFRAASKKDKCWTKDEKNKLLDAINKHGVNNYNKLHEAVPKRSVAEIKNYLLLTKVQGAWRGNYVGTQPCLEQWMELLAAKNDQGHFAQDDSKEISRFLQLIADEELHPPPEKCGGVDFKELYSFLSQVLSGQHPREVSTPSARVLHELCRFLSTLSATKDMSGINAVLRNTDVAVGKQTTARRTYGKKPLIKEGSTWGDPSLNPLQILTDMLELNPSDLDKWNDVCFHPPAQNVTVGSDTGGSTSKEHSPQNSKM